jgi:ribosomal protein L16/L10AE
MPSSQPSKRKAFLSEARIQRRIQKALREAFPGCVIYKIHGNEFQVSGIPDLVCCIEGRFVALEVKTPKGELSAVQVYEIVRIKNAGGIVSVVQDEGEALHVVREALTRTSLRIPVSKL